MSPVAGADMRDGYVVTHWAVRGQPPGYHTADKDVCLPGRNIAASGTMRSSSWVADPTEYEDQRYVRA